MSEVKTQLLDSDDVEAAGFAKFNGGPHLCVEIPDGHFAISARTSEGRKVTFAFCPYSKDGPAQCVDVHHHDTNAVQMNGVRDCQIQNCRLFSVGGRHDVTKTYTDEKPVTLYTVILKPSEKRICIPAKKFC